MRFRWTSRVPGWSEIVERAKDSGNPSGGDPDMKLQADLGSNTVGGRTEPAMMDVEELLGTRLLIQGNSGSGKSHLLRRLLEQSAAHVQQGIVDPEGDFTSLADKFGHVVIDANRPAADLQHVAVRVRQKRVSFVLDLSALEVDQQMIAAGTFLNALFDMDREFWYPMLVAVDEAQLFAPAAAGDVSEEARRVSLGAMTNLMCRGRKRGLAGIIATQRLAKLAKNVAAEASNFLMGRTFLDIDMRRAADLLGMEPRQAEAFRDLQRGQFIALGPALSRRPISVTVGPVTTEARGSTPTLTPLPERPTEEMREELLAGAPVPVASPRAPIERRPPEPVLSTNDLLAKVAEQAEPEPAAETPQEAVERERTLLTLAAQILEDEEAAFRSESVLYQDFLVRCRIRRVGGAPVPMTEFRRYLNVARAGVDADTATGEMWQRTTAVGAGLPEDLQAPFLRVAAAAMRGDPCPSDEDLAYACGLRSPARARIRLGHLDKSGGVVLKTDMRKMRIANLPDLGWETAPGDPDAPRQGLPVSMAAE